MRFQICAILIAVTGCAQTLTQAQMNARAKAQNVPEIPFESVPNFLKMPPNLFLGEGIGVATNSKGHIFVYTRSQDTRLFEFDQKGVFVREIGQGLYGFVFAHAVRVDKDDNIWCVDEGSNMVIKFNPEGRVMMVLGRRPESVENLPATPPANSPPPVHQNYLFDRPTDVAWDAAGNIFVSDGYGNSRVAKYDKNGRFIASVGSKGNAPGQLFLPHTIATDAKGNVYVGDRTNRRIQVFDNDLTFKAIYDNVGAPWSLCVTPGPHQYLYSSNSNPDNNNAEIAAVTGEIYKMELDGTIIGRFGSPGKALGNFGTVHEIDCRNESDFGFGNYGLARAEVDSEAERGEVIMKKILFLLPLLACAQSIPEIPYDAADLLKLPTGTYMGEAAGVATNSKGNIFVYTRTGSSNVAMGGSRAFTRGGARLFEFAPNGNFVREIGQGVYGFLFAHVVRVDPQDNIWVVDEGSNMIMKFNPAGQIVMVMGRKPEAVRVPAAEGGEAGPGRGGPPGAGVRGDNFNRPTDVAWDAAGNIFVADGYGNSRVAKFDKNGKFLKSWGQKGKEPGQFDLLHSMAIDAQGNVYIGDRTNRRIQVFDNDGNFKTQYTNIGAPYAICISPGAHQYLFTSNSNPSTSLENGEIYKMELNGQIVGKFGRAGKAVKEFGTVHEIDCRNPEQVFVGELINWRVQKVTLKAAK